MPHMGDPKQPTATGAHGAEQALIDARRAKVERVRGRGENPYANDVVARLPNGHTYDVAEVRAFAKLGETDGRHDTAKVEALAAGKAFHVRGRVIAIRSGGGLSFVRLRDRTGE